MTRRSAIPRWVLITLLVAAVGSLAAAAPAGAYVRDFEALGVLTPSNSNTVKSLQLSCGALKAAIGAGASIPRLGNLGINDLGISFYGQYVVDGAGETDSVPTPWALTDRPWCALSTAAKPNVSAAAAYLKSPRIERDQSAANSEFAKLALAKCARGSNVIGGGGNIDGATNDVAFDSIEIAAGGTQLRVQAHEVDSTTAPWTVEAHAICADITTAPTTNVYIDALFSTSKRAGLSSVNKSVTATCPAGKFVIGGGAEVIGATGATPTPMPPPDVVIKQSRPAGDGTESNAWTATAVETDPTAASWVLGVDVVCAKLGTFA